MALFSDDFIMAVLFSLGLAMSTFSVFLALLLAFAERLLRLLMAFLNGVMWCYLHLVITITWIAFALYILKQVVMLMLIASRPLKLLNTAIGTVIWHLYLSAEYIVLYALWWAQNLSGSRKWLVLGLFTVGNLIRWMTKQRDWTRGREAARKAAEQDTPMDADLEESHGEPGLE